MSEFTFLPNGSYFYNLETKRLHAGVLDESGVLSQAGSIVSPLTFNLVSKEYPTDARPDKEPSKFYSVLEFPTTQTVGVLLEILRKAVSPFTEVKVVGKTFSPKRFSDAPMFVMIGPEGDEAILGGRDLAYYAITRSESDVVAWVRLALKDYGIF